MQPASRRALEYHAMRIPLSVRRLAIIASASVPLLAAAALPALPAELKVVATIKPIHSLAAAVMEGVGQPSLLIDGGGSPHTFTLKPSDARRLHEATVVIRVSEGLEPFTIKIARTLPSSVKLVTLDDVPGLTLHELRTGETFEGHSHGSAKAGQHDHGHQHADHAKSGKNGANHDEHGIDGHIWLDPGNAKTIAASIAETLAAAAPEHTGKFRANAAALAGRIDALSDEIEGLLAPLKGRPYIVFHDAYQYLERRYGLEPAGSVAVSPEVPPSAKRISQLRKKISGLKATCVFGEPQFEPKLVNTIIEGTGARKGVLDPLGAAIPAGPAHYPALLRALAKDLSSCLANPA